MIQDIRRRMGGDLRRGDLSHLVRSRVALRRRPVAFAAPANFPVYRYMTLVGPIAPELGTENKTWTETVGRFSGASHSAVWDPLSTPTSYVGATPLWVQRMHPVRFRIEGYQLGLSYSTFFNSYAIPIVNRFNSLVFPVTGLSSVLPPSTSHVALNVSSIGIPNSGFFHRWYTYPNATTTVATTHYRVWVDGVDRTGIVALPAEFAHIVNPSPAQRHGGLITASGLSVSDTVGKSVWFDLWVTVRTLGRADGSPLSYFPVCQIDPFCRTETAEFTTGNVNAKRIAGDRYKFSFSNAGPLGLSQITPSTSGWTITESSASQRHNHATAGFLDFKWFSESPHIDLKISTQNNVPRLNANPVMRYMPVNTGNYQLRLMNGSFMRPGVWNPQAATVFQQVARQFDNVFYVRGSGELPSNFYTGFPDTITVEKV